MIAMRKQSKDLFVYGAFEFLNLESEEFLVYQKTSDGEKAIVILNMSGKIGTPPVSVPEDANLMAHTHNKCGAAYHAYEGRVYVMSN